MKKLLALIALAVALSGCAISMPGSQSVEATKAAPTKAVVIVPKAPTATNFPRIGTPTPVPPTPTPKPTPTPLPQEPLFTDAVLSDMMAGTISSAGVESTVEIIDERASGGERAAHITIVSEYNLTDNDLLLKLFVLEVGNALRTIRAFSEGTMNADLDSAFLTVNNKQGELLGTVSAPMPEIVRLLDGQSSVDEALTHLTLTGVFEPFKK